MLVDVGQQAFLQHSNKRKYTQQAKEILQTAICHFVIYNEEAGGLFRCFYSSYKQGGVMIAGKHNKKHNNGKLIQTVYAPFYYFHKAMIDFNTVSNQAETKIIELTDEPKDTLENTENIEDFCFANGQ